MGSVNFANNPAIFQNSSFKPLGFSVEMANRGVEGVGVMEVNRWSPVSHTTQDCSKWKICSKGSGWRLPGYWAITIRRTLCLPYLVPRRVANLLRGRAKMPVGSMNLGGDEAARTCATIEGWLKFTTTQSLAHLLLSTPTQLTLRTMMIDPEIPKPTRKCELNQCTTQSGLFLYGTPCRSDGHVVQPGWGICYCSVSRTT